MTERQLERWKKLQNFQLDDPNADFSFSDRLARENDWSLLYCHRAIDEYKKFIFLATFADHAVTPSDEIDQVWHLHLLYTQSYWQEMCAGILGTEIHHGPTKGIQQRENFKHQYSKTLASYQHFFKESPPDDIWPEVSKRFKYVNFQRVNMHTHKVRKKWL